MNIRLERRSGGEHLAIFLGTFLVNPLRRPNDVQRPHYFFLRSAWHPTSRGFWFKTSNTMTTSWGGAAGQALAFRRLARGVGRILHVTLETFVMEHARRAECEDGQACLAGEPPGSNWEWE